VSLDALADALEPARVSQHIGKRARVCGLARTISQPGSRRLLVEATGGPEPLLAANHDRPVVHPRSQLREHASPKNHTSQQRLHDVTDFRGLHRGRRTHADSTPSQPTLPIGHRLALIVHRHQPRREVRTEAHQNWATRSGRATLTFRLRAINVPLRQASQGHSRPLGTEKLAQDQAHTLEFKQFPSCQCEFDSRHPLHARIPLQQNCIREFPISAGPCFGPRPGHFGPHLSTPRHSPFSFRRRSACSVMFSGRLFSGSSNLTQGMSPPQLRARREGTRPVIPGHASGR
jgi:hypothetical protein